LSTEISKQVVLARLRRYPDVEHYLLQPHKVPFELYTNVVNVIQEELAPHMRRYARLRKRVLGLDKMLYCDLKAPLDPTFDPRITYEEASEMILASVACLGEEYHSFIRTALTQRWVDRADNIGKSSGAFCASPFGAHPFILVTWTGSMRDAFVLAHELGHAGHFGLAMKYQRMINLRPGMPFVEMPSTMNETLLARHVLARSKDQRMRRWVIMQTLGTYHHNFVTHLLEAQLQRELYSLAEKGESITAALLNRLKAAILAKFWGDSVEIDEGASMTWMRQPHYYLGLYPYTYSVGLAASTALAVLVEEQGQAATERWLRVLKAGGTLKPLELMKEAGIDMSSPEPIRKAVAYVGSLIDELEASFGP
ncbi:MAG TPA: M3 family metallopeptidase, partial [Ramlibacter sp.]|nr:M3 family metallopeptidase [Ramlibacter sp.]